MFPVKTVGSKTDDPEEEDSMVQFEAQAVSSGEGSAMTIPASWTGPAHL